MSIKISIRIGLTPICIIASGVAKSAAVYPRPAIPKSCITRTKRAALAGVGFTQVNVTRVAHHAIAGQGISTDHYVFNFVYV